MMTVHPYYYEWEKLQGTIGKIIASLQLLIEDLVLIETISILKCVLGTAHAHWLSNLKYALRNIYGTGHVIFCC